MEISEEISALIIRKDRSLESFVSGIHVNTHELRLGHSFLSYTGEIFPPHLRQNLNQIVHLALKPITESAMLSIWLPKIFVHKLRSVILIS